jgi:GAF domain-containing protein
VAGGKFADEFNRAIETILVAQSAGEEAFTPDEKELLGNIAHHLGVAAYAVQSTRDLQRLREQVGSGNAALVNRVAFVQASGALPVEALLEAVRSDMVERQSLEELLASGMGWEP